MEASTSSKGRQDDLVPGTSALPLSKVNKIIKADKDVRLCSKEAIFLIAKTTEYMIGKLTNTAWTGARLQKREKTVKYSDLATAVWSKPEWFYLVEVIPRTMPFSTALAIRQLDQQNEVAQIANSVTSSSNAAPPAKVVKKSRAKPAAAPAPATASTSTAGQQQQQQPVLAPVANSIPSAAAIATGNNSRPPAPVVVAHPPVFPPIAPLSISGPSQQAAAHFASPFHPTTVASAHAPSQGNGFSGLAALGNAAAVASISMNQSQAGPPYAGRPAAPNAPTQASPAPSPSTNGHAPSNTNDKMQVDQP